MLVKIALLLIVSTCPVFAGCATNPVTGSRQLMLISPEQELEIGRQYSPEVEKQLGGPISDPQIQSYVAGVGARIARVSHMPELEFGMLRSIRTEAQLAAVLAHETVHVTARHSADAMSKQIGLGILLSAVTGEETPQTLVTVAELGAQMLTLKYSRSAEYEADIFGLDYMARAGYQPGAMVELMEILESQNSQRPIEFFSTHPSPSHRKERVLEHIASMNLAGEPVTGRTEYSKNVLERL